jgi:hypothetical protein
MDKTTTWFHTCPMADTGSFLLCGVRIWIFFCFLNPYLSSLICISYVLRFKNSQLILYSSLELQLNFWSAFPLYKLYLDHEHLWFITPVLQNAGEKNVNLTLQYKDSYSGRSYDKVGWKKLFRQELCIVHRAVHILRSDQNLFLNIFMISLEYPPPLPPIWKFQYQYLFVDSFQNTFKSCFHDEPLRYFIIFRNMRHFDRHL